jgi:ABC-type uncharacterized transport system involved in gliding motility auxiliary subunit
VPGDLVGKFLDDLLAQYQNFTDKLTVRRIDPEQQPDQARLYGVAQYPSVAFIGDYGQRLIRPFDIITQLEGGEFNIEAEYAFTSAILEVTGTMQRKVYFLTGHGENNVLSTASGQYSTVREGLMDNLFQVETLDIRLGGDIPEDAALLVIAGPRGPLEPREVDAISRYLDEGRPALILVNPNPPAEVRELISRWGLNIEDGIINDEESYAEPNKDSPLVPPVRNYFAQLGMIRDTYFPGATALIPQEELPAGLLHIPLVWTSKKSWLEKDFQPGQERRFDEGKDVEGPLAIGVLVATISADAAQADDAQPSLETRAIIFGDSDFAGNGHFQNGDNGNLFLTAVSILTAGTELITMDRKVLQSRRLIVSPEAKSFIEISSMALLPIMVLAIGGIVWWRRR